MMYQVYMGELALPVAPSKIQTEIKNRNETIELIDGSEVNLLKMPGLTDIKFDALIPATPYPFAFYEAGFLTPHYFLDSFELMKTSKEPFLFKVLRRFVDDSVYFDTETMNASLESYTIQESSDNGMDLVLSVSLKKYEPFTTHSEVMVTEEADGTVVVSPIPQRPAKKAARSYTVRQGDNLWKICMRELGDGNKFAEVAKKNGISNPNHIQAGQVIRFE